MLATDGAPSRNDHAPRDHLRDRLRAGLGLGLIVAASAAGNLLWIATNEVLLGNDPAGHLSRTLKVAAKLQVLTPDAVIEALTATSYRPPALYLLVQPFYWRLGRTPDSAQLANVALTACLLCCTYLLGRRVAGRGTSLLAAALTAFLPLMTAVSRIFYLEPLVTLSVTAGVLCLLNSEGFTRRRWSLAWGAVVGIGLLAKWTLPVYLLLPTLLTVWQARLWRAWEGAGQLGPRRVGAAAACAAVGALAIAWVLYWPARGAWQATWLGPRAAAAWFVLWFVCLFCLFWHKAPATNFLAALALAAAIAGLWYLPEAGFIFTVTSVAMGNDRGVLKPGSWTDPAFYWRYFSLFYRHHLGLLASAVMLPFGLLPWLRHGRLWLRTRPGAAQLWVGVLSPFVLLTFTAQTGVRNLVPILPLFAILLSMALAAYPPHWRRALAVVWVAVLVAQWTLFTFDGLREVRMASGPLWVSEGLAAAPASGVTDRGYAIVPEVLRAIAASSPTTTTLGVLLDMEQLNSGTFEYPILAGGLPIDVVNLGGIDVRGPEAIIANRWVLVKNGDNREMTDAPEALVQEIAAGAPWFHKLYSPVHVFDLPNGEAVTLYCRAAGPDLPYQFSTLMANDVPASAQVIRDWWSDVATLAFAEADTAVWLGTQPLPLRNAIIPLPGGRLSATDLAGVAGPVIVVSRYETEELRDALSPEFAFVQETTNGEFTVGLYVRTRRPATVIDAEAAWPGIRLQALRTWRSVLPGDVLPLELEFAGQMAAHGLAISARLVDRQGIVVAQQDKALENAGAGAETFLLFVPPAATPGRYGLELVLYDAQTLAPIPDTHGRTDVVAAAVDVAAPTGR
jgi:4-amino-4-deoxy-L-arabinose transferase-like glycosyltransferase